MGGGGPMGHLWWSWGWLPAIICLEWGGYKANNHKCIQIGDLHSANWGKAMYTRWPSDGEVQISLVPPSKLPSLGGSVAWTRGSLATERRMDGTLHHSGIPQCTVWQSQQRAAGAHTNWQSCQ